MRLRSHPLTPLAFPPTTTAGGGAGPLAAAGLALSLIFVGCGSKGAAAVDGATPDGPLAGGDGAPDAGDTGPVHSHCPTTLPGPDLVRVGWSGGVAFCIDSTEVTNAHYAAFLAAAAPASTQDPRCAWNTSFSPSATQAGCAATYDPAARASFPVVCVDWCDADAYCRWAGKHLCRRGSLDGSDPGPVQDLTASDGSEWVIACSNDGALTYPYGTAMAGVCVDKKYVATPPNVAGLQPVKTATGCEGGVPGLFDMAGNASEWQNDCVPSTVTDSTGSTDECDAYGGSVSSDYPDTACAAAAVATDLGAHFMRAQVAADNGFRCCADAVFF